MMYCLYRASTAVAWPAARLVLRRRVRSGKEDPFRLPERFGVAGRDRPPGRLVWMHGASIGETLALLPLVERIRVDFPRVNVLVTSGTVTSARILAERLPHGAVHQFVPLDRRAFARRFLDHWRPDIVIWSESDFWPNLIFAARERKIPLVLVNGRMSARSHAQWRWGRGLIGPVLRSFRLLLAQTDADAHRIADLGKADCACCGNLKFAAPPLPADPKALQTMVTALGDRSRWLAASTHPGEEDLIGKAHRLIRRTVPEALTMIVPRHPTRGPGIAESLRGAGFSVALRSANDPIDRATEIYVADTLGELGIFYRLTDVAFIGKSLVGEGGQNPVEPARLGCALVFGPSMTNFAEIAEKMVAAGGALRVRDPEDLAEAVTRLLTDAADRARRIAVIQGIAEEESRILDLDMERLSSHLASALVEPKA